MHPSLSDEESFRSHGDSSQNPLNRQSILDFGLDNSDFMVNTHDSLEARSKGMMPRSSVAGFPKDTRNNIM